MKTYKATLRIPTKQMYAYIEIVVEGNAEDIARQYLEITDTYKKLQFDHDQQEKLDKPPF